MHKTIIFTLLAALALSVSVTAQPWAYTWRDNLYTFAPMLFK